MIATLPMYDFPELRTDTNAWWAGIARHAGVDLPLSRPEDHHAPWAQTDLVFSQTCGYPLTHRYRGKLGLIGTPHYAVPGCEGFCYSSFVFAREQRQVSDYRHGVAAVNARDSMSGMLALKQFFIAHARDGNFFKRTVISDSHLASLAVLQRGEADVCAIDAVCVAYVKTYRPDLLDGLYRIGQTVLVPGLPYVSNDPDLARWRTAVAGAVADPALADVRKRLMISGFSVTTAADYDAIPAVERQVQMQGDLRI